MKTFAQVLILLCTFFVGALVVQAQIEDRFYHPIGYCMFDVQFLSPTKVVGCGSLGTILISDSLFVDWKQVSKPTKEHLRSLCFVDSIGVCVGDNGTIIRSKDYGVKWETINSPYRDTLFSISNLGDNFFAVGTNGLLLRSTNKGRSWEKIPSQVTNTLRSIAFSALGIGIICGDKGTILRSADSGQTWIRIQTENRNRLNSIAWANDSICVAVGDKVIIERSLNGGLSWENTQLYKIDIQSTANEIYDICFSNNGVGFLVGDFFTAASPSKQRIWFTNDTGVTWNFTILSNPDTIPDISPERELFT